MEIELIKSKQRLTKNLVRQMPRGYKILCQPLVTLGHVVNIVPGELKTAIIKSGDEYYTLPLDFYLNAAGTSAYRKTTKGTVEFKFSQVVSPECKLSWWKAYEVMREAALLTHIYIC